MMDCLKCSQTTFWLDVIIWTENTNSVDQPRCAETCLLSDEYHIREIFLFSDANQTIIYVRRKKMSWKLWNRDSISKVWISGNNGEGLHLGFITKLIDGALDFNLSNFEFTQSPCNDIITNYDWGLRTWSIGLCLKSSHTLCRVLTEKKHDKLFIFG